MRFDEFVALNGVALSPVDRFDGFAVDVGVPPDWEPFDSAAGIGVWICRSDPRIDQFCANAVLTLHHVEAPLDAADVFAMLSEQQLQSVPGCRELHRELATATEGPGVTGVLTMQINHELGVLDSVSRSRIITTEQETLIAQLTVTALHDSPVDRENIWLAVRLAAAVRPPTGNDGGAPVVRKQEGR
ncbi:LpqN/LpqT family lipoprotein [Mycobacterium sp. CSUR Q5927]|nr:LpqN/LpqT family lipoprotein [Mycobacterium sp. CSUR Q5927]